ncbi:GNAT family N-acetyltransferase [Cohnella lubricantis]|uniref:GNAT family N-acetyltransferase n=1 Tax=Cohnella lubricantis TaxID=2163172 RepID=A0A841TAS6_9BACL|nr:GNAT family N-acetyltransferase [Cohnella lubricantis]MBB6677135.1 GNAT family N-acetyltransferase [Cohnella lubricantis]MBP2118983.1 GNAT superfamily N-acetyltransferase [Cohnella lubricantis]
MPKPSSIKTAQILLYLKLILTATILLPVLPIPMIALIVILIAANLYAIHKRKRMWAFILALVTLYFTADIINLVLSFAIIVLLFTRSSRLYFLGDALPAAPAPAPETGEAVDAEGYTVDEEEDRDPASDELARGELTAEASDAEDRRNASAGASDAAVPSASSLRPNVKPSADPVVEIREAGAEDAAIVHGIMLEAFEEYRAAVPPSSALSETEESVREGLASKNESAAILSEDGIPAAIVRYRLEEDAIYFFRLSVRPARRKRGYARQLLEWIEMRGRSQGRELSRCKVRQSVSRNLVLYENMGYEITNQELVVRPEGSVKTLTMEKRLTNY